MRVAALVILLLVAITAGLGVPLRAHAQGESAGDRWGIAAVPNQNPAITEKGYFVYPLQPGERAGGQVLLRNPGATPITIDLFLVNAETAQKGGSAFATGETSTAGVADWIELSERQATIAPGTERPVSFTVHIPEGVTPGQYLAGIAATETPIDQPVEAAAQSGLGTGVTMRSRYVIGVEADVAGDWQSSLTIPNASVLDQPSGTVVGVQLRNDGGTFLKPSGTITVADAQGAELLSEAVDMGTFVPGTEVTYPIQWPGQPAPGSYTVAVNLTYADGKTATYNGALAISDETAQHAAERANATPPAAAQPASAAQPPPAAQPTAVAAVTSIAPWMVYMLAGFLVLIVVLLTLNLLQGRLGKRAV